ncbi:hypothetical protein [Paenibacillus antri]|nr:hypothetical protein [Paenibacillus antri]
MKLRVAYAASRGLGLSARWFVKGFKFFLFSPEVPKELSKE